jgi:hypothetical protein
MAQQIVATTQDGRNVGVQIDHFPDQCPICHHGIEPRNMGLAHLVEARDGVLEMVFRCPRMECQSFFISRYTQRYYQALAPQVYFFNGSVPFQPKGRGFSERISSISPMFCQIYNQALNAERAGWALIAGPGYRKALEFLVKDYLCGLKPDDCNKIKSMQLGPCIGTFVDNDKVKQMAQRAAWLGNDETHYLRKWEDHDLPDLKTVIDLTVLWIDMEEMTKQVMKDLPEGRK